jgi:hypothetical protein
MPNNSRKRFSMNVSREVILDLLPLFASGEASSETRALVEEYLRQDPELLGQLDLNRLDELKTNLAPAVTLPAEAELRSVRRTQGLLRWQRRAYGWALALTAVSASGVGYIRHGRPVYHFFFLDHPQLLGSCAVLAVSCWLNYFIFRWRLRSTRKKKSGIFRKWR